MCQTRTLLLPATILLFSLASSWPTTAAAQHYPLSYSGRIVDDKGEPRVGPVDLEFSFYDADQAGNRLGASPYRRTVTLSEGVFQVTLELPADEAASIFANQDSVWFEVKDVGADKIFPRQRFTYVPYAMRVPVNGTTLGYDATTGQLKVLTVLTNGASSVSPGTGLTSSISNGAVTLNVDVGTSANKIVQLDANAKLPAIDGSLLTNLNPANLSGAVSVAKGGTGASSLTSNGILYGNNASAVQATVAGSQYQVLQAGAGGVPTFAAVNLGQSTAITGTLPVASGGTGSTTATANHIFAAPSASSGAPSFRALVGADLPIIVASSPLSWTASSGSLGIAAASTSTSSYLSAANWNTFNNKVSSPWSSSGGNIAYNSGNIGIGTTAPAALLSVGSSSQFQVNASGDLVSIRGVAYSWPATQGTANQVLTNNGSGTLSWTSAAGGSSQWTTSGSNIHYSAGKVGVGTTAPVIALDVTGQIRSKIYDAGAGTSFDWDNGNIQYTTATCGSFAFADMQDGASYTLIVKSLTQGTCIFSQAGLTFRSQSALTTASGTYTVFNFIVAGADVFVQIKRGF